MKKDKLFVKRLMSVVLFLLMVLVIPCQGTVKAYAADKFENSSFYQNVKKQVEAVDFDAGVSCDYDPDTETITVKMFVSPATATKVLPMSRTIEFYTLENSMGIW